ncbi:MAG: hypothetical protein NTU51_00275 [Bacteroidetes bacterium]|nr:hypothetical protein [Bacteroidota bacterium]
MGKQGTGFGSLFAGVRPGKLLKPLREVRFIAGFLFFIPLVCMNFASTAQVCTFNKQYLDTLKKGRPTGNLYLGFYFLQDAVQYLYLTSTASGLVQDSHNLYEISGVINYQGLRERSTNNTGYVFVHSNLFNHSYAEGKLIKSKLSMEPFAMFQFDEDRGINARWQTGVYAVPLILERQKIRIQAGFGFLYQWDRYDLLPPDYEGWWSEEEWKVIKDDIKKLDHDSTGFAWRNGVRAAAYLSFNGTFGKIFDMNIIVSYQQPFVSNFKGTELYDVSADFKTPYPCITVETIMNFKLLKWLAVDLRYYMQHDRNQVTFYLPYYMYSVTMGVSFTI